MKTRNIRIQIGVAAAVALVTPVAAHTTHKPHELRMPLSSALLLLEPPGSSIAYRGDVDSDQLVEIPAGEDNTAALQRLLNQNGLQSTEQQGIYTISRLGDANINVPTSQSTATTSAAAAYNSPGFSFSPPPAPTPAAAVTSAFPTNPTAPVSPVSATPVAGGQHGGQPISLLAATGVAGAPSGSGATTKVSIAPPTGAVASATSAAPPPKPPEPTWTLQANELASRNLMDWASKAGWQVTWNFPKDVMIAHSATFSGQFDDAAEQVVKLLRAQLQQYDPTNATIRYDDYPPNKQFVVSGGNSAPASASNSGDQ